MKFTFILILFGLLLTTTQSLFQEGGHVHELQENTWNNVTTSHHLWIVLFCSPSSPQCQKLAPEYAKAADELKDYVRFGAVDCDAHKSFAASFGVIDYPTVLGYKEPPTMNPYTGKLYRQHFRFDGIPGVHSKVFTRFGFKHMPSYVTSYSEEDFDEFINNKKDEEKVVVLLSEKSKVAPLYKALSTEFYGRGLQFVQISESSTKFTKLGEVGSLPALFLVENYQEGKISQFQDGDIKKIDHLINFLKPHAQSAAESLDQSKNSPTVQWEWFDEQMFNKIVINGKLSWIITFSKNKEDSSFPSTSMMTLKEELKKIAMISIASVDCESESELCAKFGGEGTVVFPYTDEGVKKETSSEKVSSLEEAKELAIESLPNKCVPIDSSQTLNLFILNTKASGLLPVIIITKKQSTSPIIKSLSMALEDRVRIGIFFDPPKDVMKQFGATSLPWIVSIIQEDKSKEDHMIVSYNRKQYGALSFISIANYIAQVYNHAKPRGLSWAEASQDQESTQSSSHSNQDVKPIQSLTPSNWKEMCLDQTLCVIGLFRGPADKVEEDIQVLEAIAAKSRLVQDPFSFSWINGLCYSEFVSGFDIDVMNLPTLVVLSPKKMRYVAHVGTLDEESGRDFLRSVLSGRIGTIPMSQLPVLDDRDCTSEINEKENLVIEDMDMGDMMQEILAEEARKKLELEQYMEEQERLRIEEMELAKRKERESQSKKKRTKKKKGRKSKKTSKKSSQQTKSQQQDKDEL